MGKNGRQYKGAVKAYRLDLFAKQAQKVADHNAKPGVSYTMKLDKFADWTQEEFDDMLTLR
jgi:hypothetical protein